MPMRIADQVVHATVARALEPGCKNKKANPEAGFLVDGAPGEIRTPDPQVRSLVLYPAELRAR